MKKDTNPSKGKPAGGMTAENTNMHKLLKMGQNPKFVASNGKKTPA
jgi:hypothetical protein